jgi:hypothetical protein
MMAAAHPPSIRILHAACMYRASRLLSNDIEARMSLPRAASCDLQEQGTGLVHWRQDEVGLL